MADNPTVLFYHSLLQNKQYRCSVKQTHENINNKHLSLRYKQRVYPDERVEIRLDWESDRKGTGISLKFAFHLRNADPRIKLQLHRTSNPPDKTL